VTDWPAPLTVGEVASELGCSVDDVRALIRGEELQTVACGVRPGLVPRHQLDAYVRRRDSGLARAAHRAQLENVGDTDIHVVGVELKRPR
jgi:excisionase family DNA binding protein